MPITPTATIRARALGDLTDAGNQVSNGFNTAASGIAAAPSSALGAAGDQVVGGIVDHKKDQATNDAKKYVPYIFCGVGAIVIIAVAWYFWRKNRKNKALSRSAGDEDLGDK